MMTNDKLVLAFSGGMDSSVLLFMVADRGYKEIHTVTFDYGQRHSKELQCVELQKQNLLKQNQL
jgi:7-cyano-7-deazaguanine synthase